MTVTNKIQRPFVIKLAAIFICILAAGYLAIIAKELFVPLLFALLFSILLLPLAKWFEKKLKLPRGTASFASLLVLVAGVTFIFYTVGSQISNLADDWPLFQTQLHTSITQLQSWLTSEFHLNLAKQKAYINNAASKALSTGSSVVSSTLLSVSSILLLAVLTFIYTFFILLYRSTLLKFLVALATDENSRVIYDVVENIQLVIRKYILGILFEMFIVAVICCTAFGMLGIKYFILLGILTALFNIVPYVGIFSSLLLSLLITFATSGVSPHLLIVLITIVSVHLIDSNILLPFIVGSKVSINAMITVIGVVIGEMMWGIPGMFLSVPVIAMTKIICDRVETLKPWAILLGHEKNEKKVLKLPKIKKRVVKTVSSGTP